MPRAVSPNRYATRTMRHIEGSLAEIDAHLLIATSDLQVSLGVTGSVAEIGVAQGRLFLLLDLLRRSGDRALAVDVFDRQDLNIDGSGWGDQAAFERNLRRVGRSIDDVQLIADSSLNVSADRIKSLVGPVRLFSVDGGHTLEVATNDLRLAQDSLAHGGVVFVDDVFHFMWPGVAEAVGNCMREESFQLLPIALTKDKLLLSHRDYVDSYSQGLGEVMQSPPIWASVIRKEFYGHPILVVSEFSRATKRQIVIGAHPAYQLLRRSTFVAPVRARAIRVNQRLG